MRLLAAIKSLPPWLRSGLASLCLLGAAIIISLPYSIPGWIWDRSINYRPSGLTGIVALALMAPLFLADLFVLHRRADGMLAIVMNTVSALLLIYVVAAFASVGTGGNSWTSGPTSLLALVVVGLSIFNYRRYGELAAIALVILASWNLTSANAAMGVLGFYFVALSVIGLVLALDVERIIRLILTRRQRAGEAETVFIAKDSPADSPMEPALIDAAGGLSFSRAQTSIPAK